MKKNDNSEESKKNVAMSQADDDLREIPIDEIQKIIDWWNYWRIPVGWRRLSKVMTVYAKEIRFSQKK
jgi:hypothetical protein